MAHVQQVVNMFHVKQCCNNSRVIPRHYEGFVDVADDNAVFRVDELTVLQCVV